MQPRLFVFATVFRSTAPLTRGERPVIKSHIPSFVCRSCQRKFSTSPTLRFFGKSAKEGAKAVEKDRKYPSRLLIYDAGDARTTWISFWKAMALLQFGTTLVFGVPPLWNNENQPDPRLRKMQAILVGVLGTIPTLTLAYLTAPFVHQIFLQIPEHARRSRHDLLRFASTLRKNPLATANTKLEFVTLRIFPFRKHTTAFLHELRALPQRRFRLANIELPKTDAWAQRQREKGIFKRVLDVINEPRFKFYVKEGRLYTMKTKVPGVWEEVAERIRDQTIVEREEQERRSRDGAVAVTRKPVVPAKRVSKPVLKVDERIKRQTTRSLRK
ncbi:hypothetical protein BM1_00621 [Bipolaris maydis]|nr:hypothetical protein BM1_00621 [Bipolaris maydis]KAJ5025740.1 hypothetical protein J3E73DRAFT_191286 [Bipolaris maydis]KAJ6269953.1 hypothetical protein PSV08DRAFT_372275 [Bipolaris maydis]KAJ6280238.1 hypothetical protein J3E71DRAFT_343598 [Bipolaris maydis]